MFDCLKLTTFASIPSIQVSRYASIQVSQVCKYASMQVCKYASLQVCKYAKTKTKNKETNNIARGTTDPGYWVYNLNCLFDWIEFVIILTLEHIQEWKNLAIPSFSFVYWFLDHFKMILLHTHHKSTGCCQPHDGAGKGLFNPFWSREERSLW